MMQQLRRSVASSLSRRSALLRPQIAAASVSSPAAIAMSDSTVGFARSANIAQRDVLGSNVRRYLGGLHSSPQPSEHLVINNRSVISIRQFASRASDRKGKTESETRKEVSKVEDPFDAPTYNIPEKPVTFVEGASYSFIILIGLGIAAAAAYAVFNELIFQPKEYKIFNKALKRIQDDGQVRVRIGSPITGYGQETRNRAARQRIPHRIWTDEDGVEQIEVNFYIRGPQGAGKVFCRMFKDKEEKDWKFTSLIVQILAPSPAQLLLESYVPA